MVSCMRITLLTVKDKNPEHRKGENLGLKALEAILVQRGYDVLTYDLNINYLDDIQICKEILQNDSDVIGFSVSFTHQIYETLRLAKMLKQHLYNKHFTLGGQGASFIMKEVLEKNDFFDTGICFEGEFALLELLDALKNKLPFDDISGLCFRKNDQIIFNGYRNPVDDLDVLPFVKHTENSKVLGQKHLTMISSRGCYGQCLFCASGYSANKLHSSKKWRCRSADNLLMEIGELAETFGTMAISFVDDDFLGGTDEGYQRVTQLSKGLIDKKLNSALKKAAIVKNTLKVKA